MEIEKKYLVDKTKVEELLKKSLLSVRINQYYLNDMNDNWLIRARSMDDEYFLTLKSKGLVAREELEYQINEEDFLKTIAQAKTKLLKTRHYLLLDGTDYHLEIDVYDDYDFVTCEVEFNGEEELTDFNVKFKPSWCVEDVTEDRTYKNVNLAK